MEPAWEIQVPTQGGATATATGTIYNDASTTDPHIWPLFF